MGTHELQIVTNEALKESSKFDVVTPSLYEDIFYSKAEDKNVAIEELNINSEAKILEKILKIQDETKKNTMALKDNIDLAKVAIENQDNEALNKISSDVEELRQRVLLLETQIYFDDLTKVYNRKWLHEKCLVDDKFITDGVLAFVDVNYFKQINDTYGHVTGDKVLFMVANWINKIENADILRYGGDEFILITKDTDISKVEKFFRNLNDSLAKKSLKYKDKLFKVSISVGIQSFKKDDEFKKILEIADQKMYDHKMEIKKRCLAPV